MKIDLFLFFLNYLIILTDMLFGLFPKNFVVIIDDILDPNYNFEDIDYDHDPDAHYSDNDIKTKCLRCGFEENVPDFIYDEFAKKKFHKEIRKIVPTLNRQRCDHEKFIPKKYFKN